MNLDEALCIVLYLKDRPQTDMTAELREMYQRAWRAVCHSAMVGINAERLALSNGKAP